VLCVIYCDSNDIYFFIADSFLREKIYLKEAFSYFNKERKYLIKEMGHGGMSCGMKTLRFFMVVFNIIFLVSLINEKPNERKTYFA